METTTAVTANNIEDKKDASLKREETETKAVSSQKSTSSFPDWDHDVEDIPRLQVVDENQNFT
jgi:hypothetical protein